MSLFRQLARSGAAAAKHAQSHRASGTLAGKVSGLKSRVCAVLGGQWGDEGKGKLADVLAANYDVVCRFNGGANAGHTVIANGRKFAFHLLPCGLIYPHTMNILGNGTVVHLPGLFEETGPLDAAGIEWRGRLLISNRAHMLFDFHQTIDKINETRLAGKDGSGKTIGTTKKGIGPAYTAKMSRNGLRFGDLAGDWSAFQANFRKTVEAHQFMFDFEVDVQAEVCVCVHACIIRDVLVSCSCVSRLHQPKPLAHPDAN
jgi:adenylosuccinate synthase